MSLPDAGKRPIARRSGPAVMDARPDAAPGAAAGGRAPRASPRDTAASANPVATSFVTAPRTSGIRYQLPDNVGNSSLTPRNKVVASGQWLYETRFGGQQRIRRLIKA